MFYPGWSSASLLTRTTSTAALGTIFRNSDRTTNKSPTPLEATPSDDEGASPQQEGKKQPVKNKLLNLDGARNSPRPRAASVTTAIAAAKIQKIVDPPIQITHIDIPIEVMVALATEPGERTENNVQQIFEFTSRFECFAPLPQSVHYQLCKYVKYLKMEANATVYQIGDTATSFYIILNGAVKVKGRDSPGEPLRTKANLSSGQSFGELALVKDTHRTQTVITATPVELLTVLKSDYEALKITHEKDIEQKRDILNHVEVFKNWPRNDLTKLAYVMAFKQFPPNKIIIKQGELPMGVFFIKSGKCKLVKEISIGSPRKFLQNYDLFTNDYVEPPKKRAQSARSFRAYNSLTRAEFPLASFTAAPPSFQRNINNNNDINDGSKTARSNYAPSTHRSSQYSAASSSGPPKTPKQKKLLHIGTLLPGDFFGEIALLNNLKEEPISVISEGQVEVFVLFKVNFQKLIVGKTLELMKKHAATFPSDDEIRKKYFEQREWECYKKHLMEEIKQEKQRRIEAFTANCPNPNASRFSL